MGVDCVGEFCRCAVGESIVEVFPIGEISIFRTSGFCETAVYNLGASRFVAGRSPDRRRHVAAALRRRKHRLNRCTSREPGWRSPRTLPVLRQRGSQEHCAVLSHSRNGGGLNLKRQVGLDILSDKYSFGQDPAIGYTSVQKIPDRWVATTCGYCSVGCGMFIGVKDERAVAVRGNPSHPANMGKLCPKGLSEHYTLE